MGLFAVEDIENGAFVIQYVGEVLDNKECTKRLSAMKKKRATDYYFMSHGSGVVIDAKTMGNDARFISEFPPI